MRMDNARQMKAAIFQAPQSHAARHPGSVARASVCRRHPGAARSRPGNISQHLATLRARRLVVNRKEGNQVFYSVRDTSLLDVLDLMKEYCMSHLEEDLTLLKEMKAQGEAK
jgi:ArsR family transcriptional regulator